MKKYLLLLLALAQAAQASWSSDLDDQENRDPWAQMVVPSEPAIKKGKLTKSKTSLNLLADADLSEQPEPVEASSAEKPKLLSKVHVPDHERHTKYYDRIILQNYSRAGKLEVLIERDFPVTPLGEVIPASCIIRLNGKLISSKTHIQAFLEQSFWGPHDIYNLKIQNEQEQMQAVLKIPTLVDDFESFSPDAEQAEIGSEITFNRANGQVQVFPLTLKKLIYKKA